MEKTIEKTDLEPIIEDIEDVAKKPLQKIKVKKEKNVIENDEVNEKPERPKLKRVKTEKQIEVFKMARAKMLLNAAERKERKAILEAEKKKELEDKIVQKAIAIKKREIKQKAILDTIEDDESTEEEIKEIAKKIKPKTEIPRETKAISSEAEKPIKAVSKSSEAEKPIKAVSISSEVNKPLSVFDKYRFI